jgi:hypothetical protein
MTQQLYDKQNLKHIKKRLPHSLSTMSTNSHNKSSSLWSTKKQKTNVKTFLQHYNITDINTY